MDKYKFTIDQKETIWRQNTCIIEASSEEEAIVIMKSKAFDLDYDMGLHDSTLILETVDDMTYEENGNQPTREIYYNGKCIEDNTPINVRREEKINIIINGKD